mmetsp:Transcript_23416/g.47049  ORF Transcript_23416/g.47049 Transcript_23416/m.47049 type:complete len:89 (+) Transcript_23416:213-479(+)
MHAMQSEEVVSWNRLRLYISYREAEVFTCPATPKDVKNAYALFRLLGNNLSVFTSYLRTNNGEVPDVFSNATPPHHGDVEIEENIIDP